MANARISCEDCPMSSPQPRSASSALLTFRFENVGSFRDKSELSMLATGLVNKRISRPITWRQGGQPLGVVPAAVIYGANASGKTNVLRAMDDMRRFVLESFRKGSPTGGIKRRPFLLGSSEEVASHFEIDFVLNEVRHEYGFIIDDQRVVEEWAYRYPHGRPALLFLRSGDNVELGAVERSKAQAVKELLRPNALFLSTAALANHQVYLAIHDWFEHNLQFIGAGSRLLQQNRTTRMYKDSRREHIPNLLDAADIGITGVKKVLMHPEARERMLRSVRTMTGPNAESDELDDRIEIEPYCLQLIHQGAEGEVVFDDRDESLGTQMWLALIGPIVEALANGTVLLIDELDASLHPDLVAQLVMLFQDPETNPHFAQLVCSTHDATLLLDGATSLDRFEPGLLGRDQIWFTEKLADGASRLYSLADLDPRKHEAIGRRYLAGWYGGVPILSRAQFAAIAESITSRELVESAQT